MGCVQSSKAQDTFLPPGSLHSSTSRTKHTSCASYTECQSKSSRAETFKHGLQCLPANTDDETRCKPGLHDNAPTASKCTRPMISVRDSYDGLLGQRGSGATARHPEGESLPGSRQNDASTTFELVGQIRCDSDFVIESSDVRALQLLKCTESELWGKPVTGIMTPLVAKIHVKLFKFLKQASASQIQSTSKRLKYDMSNCRDLVLLDRLNDPVVVGVSIELAADCSALLNLYRVSSSLLHTVPRGYEMFINQSPGMHVQDYSGVICIMMDIAGSTEYATSVQPQAMATLMHDVYMAVNNVILREVFPYAYIHEICGDSLLIVVNAGFMVRCSGAASVIALQAATQSQRHLDSMLKRYSEKLHARVGVSVGDVTAGVIDGRSFRIFGQMVHLSQRLESVCPTGGIACSLPFMSMLEQQQDLAENMSSFGVQYSKATMKGFGELAYGVVDTAACHKLQMATGHVTASEEE